MTKGDRKHLTAAAVGNLIAATKGTRNEDRDRCLLLLMFRHGLHVSEACGLDLSQVDTESRVLHVARLLQDYPGHRDIRHTVIYTAANPARFERLWQ
jgi:site-specific recombinase XerD